MTDVWQDVSDTASWIAEKDDQTTTFKLLVLRNKFAEWRQANPQAREHQNPNFDFEFYAVERLLTAIMDRY